MPHTRSASLRRPSVHCGTAPGAFARKDRAGGMVGDRNAEIGGDLARCDQRMVTGATYPQKRGEIAQIMVGVHSLVPQARDELRDGHAVALANFAERIPEVVLDPDRSGNPINAQTMGAALPLAGVSLDEEFTH